MLFKSVWKISNPCKLRLVRCVSAAEHHAAEQDSKTGRTKPRKHLSRSSLSWNARQDFLKISCLGKAALATEQRCFSKVILESNVTPNISKSSDSFNTVSPKVKRGGWGCIVRYLETIMVLVLLAFNFILPRSHHSLTLPRSRFGDSANATLNAWGWHNSKWSHRHNRSAYSPEWKKNPMCTGGRSNKWPTALACVPPDTTLTSLLPH